MNYEEKSAHIRNTLNYPAGEMNLKFFGDIRAPQSILNPLQTEIDKLETAGHMISFIIADIDGNFGFCYNCDKKWTSQSTIKAPYLTSLLMQDKGIFELEHDLFKAVITVSDNEAYEILRTKYGNAPFLDFCKKSDISAEHSKPLYPRSITVRDMAKLWTTMYTFLNSPNGLSEYVSYFSGTAMSCIYRALGQKYKVETKAGWESGTDIDGPGGTPEPRFIDGDPLNDEIATNDTGIVYADGHPYIAAIFSNLQSDPDGLIPLVKAIDAVHSAAVLQ